MILENAHIAVGILKKVTKIGMNLIVAIVDKGYIGSIRYRQKEGGDNASAD